MGPLGTLVAAGIERWNGDTAIEEAVFGSGAPGEVAEAVERFCLSALGSGVAGAIFIEKSVGIVLGLWLADGRTVVVKGHQPRIRSSEHLAAVLDAQTAAWSKGFPAPRPLAGPVSLGDGRGHLTAEELMEGGEVADGHLPEIRGEMARCLARLVRILRAQATSALNDPWWDRMGAKLWPEPHSPLFDFSTRTGAWIDRIGAQAREMLKRFDAPKIVGHGDWSVKNLRFHEGRVAAVYDWDSLRLEREVEAVGDASVHFAATWYLDVPKAPSIEEMEAFIKEYEDARGRPFADAERRAVWLAAVYSLGYTARCEHWNRLRGGEADGEFQQLLRSLAHRVR